MVTLIDAMPGLFATGILMFFFFTVFAIIGLQLFNGLLKHQCVNDITNDVLTYRVLNDEYIAICDANDSLIYSGSEQRRYTCNEIANMTGYGGDYHCEGNRENPLAGMQNFDNIFYSLLMVFQIVTLQDWSSIMYDLSRSQTFSIAIYFVIVTFFISFFAINLILAGMLLYCYLS